MSKNERFRNLKTTIANTRTFYFHGKDFCFTRENLEAMANTAKGVPVSDNFNRNTFLGEVNSAEVVWDELIVDITAIIPPSEAPLYLVPKIELGSFRLLEVALTVNSAIPGLEAVSND